MTNSRDAIARIAYYSMEIALDDSVPTFSGGLGVLAGDHLRGAADRGVPIAGVTLRYAHGFFSQSLVGTEQRETPVEWSPAGRMEPLAVRVRIPLAGRSVTVAVWRAQIAGVGGHQVPVHFLDTDLQDNAPDDRDITDRLYTSDPYQRLRQEAVLGLAGPLVLDALGHDQIRVHHLNEGHGSLVPACLLARFARPDDPMGALGAGLPGAEHHIDDVRARCIFTTHTPVPAGHDRFSPDVVGAVLGSTPARALGSLGLLEDGGVLNMTLLGTRLAGAVNGVSLAHRDVTRAMLSTQRVDAITNGVHSTTWAAPATAALFDRHLPGWRQDSQQLRYAGDIPLEALREAKKESKESLCAQVRLRTGVPVRAESLVVGIARRFASYKRNALVLSDLDRLVGIAGSGPIQLVFAGKAHPGDADGKAMIHEVASHVGVHDGVVSVAFLEDYGMALSRLLCAGSDVWLNNPVPPNEASGTSGMKAALNGVPSLSTLDGWWIEGRLEGVTGWTFGSPGSSQDDAERLYSALEDVVVPAYYKEPDTLVEMGRHAIALNGSFFSAHRMVEEYARRAYAPALGASGVTWSHRW